MSCYQKFRRAFFVVMRSTAITVMIALTLVVIWQVLARYLLTDAALGVFFTIPGASYLKGIVNMFVVLGKSSEELAMILMIWVGFIGATIGFELRSHLGVDILFHIADPSTKKVMLTCTWLLVLVFAIVVLICGGGEMLMQSMERGNLLKTISMKRWIVYIPIPLCGFIISWLGLEQLISIFTGIDFKGDKPVETPKTEGAE